MIRLPTTVEPVNEIMSTFGEMVLTRALLARETRAEVRRELLCAKIEDTIATVFRQNVLTRFEMAAHAARRDGPVSAAQLGAEVVCLAPSGDTETTLVVRTPERDARRATVRYRSPSEGRRRGTLAALDLIRRALLER